MAKLATKTTTKNTARRAPPSTRRPAAAGRTRTRRVPRAEVPETARILREALKGMAGKVRSTGHSYSPLGPSIVDEPA